MAQEEKDWGPRDEKGLTGDEEQTYGSCVSDLDLIVGSLESILKDIDSIRSPHLKAKPLIRNRPRIAKAHEVLDQILTACRG